jgi:acyl carrier protein
MRPDELIDRIVAEFDLSGPPALDAKLAEDLEFDSLDLFFLVMLVEDCAAVDARNLPADYPILVTIGDAVAYLQQLTRLDA